MKRRFVREGAPQARRLVMHIHRRLPSREWLCWRRVLRSLHFLVDVDEIDPWRVGGANGKGHRQ